MHCGSHPLRTDMLPVEDTNLYKRRKIADSELAHPLHGF
jgi:hypothetical protein